MCRGVNHAPHRTQRFPGNPLPDDTLASCKSADAALMGSVGTPKYGPESPVRPEQGLLKIRKELGLFCNLRYSTVCLLATLEISGKRHCRPRVMRWIRSPFRRLATFWSYLCLDTAQLHPRQTRGLKVNAAPSTCYAGPQWYLHSQALQTVVGCLYKVIHIACLLHGQAVATLCHFTCCFRYPIAI